MVPVTGTGLKTPMFRKNPLFRAAVTGTTWIYCQWIGHSASRLVVHSVQALTNRFDAPRTVTWPRTTLPSIKTRLTSTSW